MTVLVQHDVENQLTLTEETEVAHKPLRTLIQKALENYFAHVDKDMPPKAVYQMVMTEVELPLLSTTMRYAQGNQSQAAQILGINRSTLRKKLQQHNLS
jgi:Fis family transcriptional regulator